MHIFLTFTLGALFGLGLYLGGMTDPGKVQGFLDIFGRWDPSLAFVMGGAVAVGLGAFQIAARWPKLFPVAATLPPPSRVVDLKTIGGAAIFGVGWGLSGVCPGPAVVNLGSFEPQFALFILGIAVGMAGERAITRKANVHR